MKNGWPGQVVILLEPSEIAEARDAMADAIEDFLLCPDPCHLEMVAKCPTLHDDADALYGTNRFAGKLFLSDGDW